MSAIKLATPSSGSISLSPANTASNLTITVPAVTGTMLTTASAGTVLQVVNSAYTTQTSTTSSTFSDTGITATITPTSATSKILVMVSVTGVLKSDANTYAYLRLLRNSTTIANIERLAGYNNSSTGNGIGACGLDFFDSPATTSATTYKVQFASGANSGIVYISSQDGGTPSTSTITLMEIAQ